MTRSSRALDSSCFLHRAVGGNGPAQVDVVRICAGLRFGGFNALGGLFDEGHVGGHCGNCASGGSACRKT